MIKGYDETCMKSVIVLMERYAVLLMGGGGAEG